jgi:hypothetical protein
MTYRSDEELATKRRNELLNEYHDEAQVALRLIGGQYAKRVALRVFAFLSPALLLLIPVINRWSQTTEFTHKKSSILLGMSVFSFLLSFLVLGLIYVASQGLASALLRRRLRQYLTPNDVYRDLARLTKRPLDFVKESLSHVDYAAPLVLLVVVVPAVIYLNQYLVGFVPFCPERSQEGLGTLSLSFFICAGLVHLYLLVVLYRLILRTKRATNPEDTTHQPGLPLILGAILLAVGYQVARLLPALGGLASTNSRAEPETLYIANAFTFMIFVVIFELIIYSSLRSQTSLPQEDPE